MWQLMAWVTQFLVQDEGAVAAEYVILVSLIATVIMLAVTALGNSLIPHFTAAASGLS